MYEMLILSAMKAKLVGSSMPHADVLGGERMARSKTFRTGGSTAIRIPKEFRIEASEVMISQTAAGLLITPCIPPATVSEWWDSWLAMPDFMEGGRNQPAPQERSCDW